MSTSAPTLRRLLGVALALALALFTAACGGDEEEGGGGAQQTGGAPALEGAKLTVGS